MGSKIQQSRSGQASGLARRQHGVLARRQLLALGFSPESIKHRLRNGRLRALAPGVYSVAQPALLTQEARWMAAVLACGDGAVLSHRSAAALWGIAREPPGRMDVSV